MQTNEINLTPKNESKIRALTEINNNILTKSEISQLFNKVYDSNFLSMINELSISIQNFHKFYVIQSSILKSLFNEKPNKIYDNIEKIKHSFNEINSLSSKFYSDAKLIFKKMKIYRSNIIKNNNQPELKTIHKKSVSINYNIDNISNKLQNLKEEIKFKKFNNLEIDIDDYNIKNYLIKGSNGINGNYEKNNIDNIYLSNYKPNNSSKNNLEISDFNKIIGDNDSSDKNKDDIILINFCDNFFKNILSSKELINCNDENSKLVNLKEVLNGKKSDLINFIKNIINISKENTSSCKNIKDNISNKITFLEDKNNILKNEFEKYKSDERIRKKFLENQIVSLSKKDIENAKIIKYKEKELNENKKNYEENIKNYEKNIKNYEENISNLESNINTLNNKINEIMNENEKLKIQYQEIIEEKNKEINKINQKYEKIINEKDQYHKNELNNICKNKDNNMLQIKNELNDLNKKGISLKEENEKLINTLEQKEIKIKELSSINQEVLKINDVKENIIEENKNIINEIKIKNTELNDINNNNNKKIINLENKIKNYEKEIKDNKEKLHKQININEEITKNYNELKKNIIQTKVKYPN